MLLLASPVSALEIGDIDGHSVTLIKELCRGREAIGG
jgi:hypothetical protein